MTASRGSAPETSPRRAADARRLLLVTGLSGAGHSSALKALEDMGYEAVDNLPLFLLGGLMENPEMLARPIAIGVDSRTRDFSVAALEQHMARLRALPGIELRLLYLDCSDDILQRRFKETRRRHPLASDRPVIDGIAQERALLAPLRHIADVAIDTSDLRLGDLKQMLLGHFAVEQTQAALSVISFSYREGLPREADLVFDVRFLRNPHYDETLRPHTGRDAAVAVIHLGHGFQDLLAALLHIVVGADADGGDAGLGPHHMLERRDEFLRQAAVGDEYHSDHTERFLFSFRRGVGSTGGRWIVVDGG